MNRIPLAALLTLTLPLLTLAQSTNPATSPAHPVEKLLAALKDQLAFIDKERPDLTQIQALQLGGPDTALLRSPAGAITGGTYQYEFNMTPNTKTEPSRPIAENLTALRVYIAIYTEDPAHPAAADPQSLTGPTLAWDKKTTARHYHIANTPWLLTIHIEGNRPALIQKCNDTADKLLNAFITTQQPAPTATRPSTRPTTQ